MKHRMAIEQAHLWSLFPFSGKEESLRHLSLFFFFWEETSQCDTWTTYQATTPGPIGPCHIHPMGLLRPWMPTLLFVLVPPAHEHGDAAAHDVEPGPLLLHQARQPARHRRPARRRRRPPAPLLEQHLALVFHVHLHLSLDSRTLPFLSISARIVK